MQIGNLQIIFVERLTVREFQQINRINSKFQKQELDEMDLANELAKILISSINGETDKSKIENLILDMDNIEDYTKLNEEVAKTSEILINPSKKKS